VDDDHEQPEPDGAPAEEQREAPPVERAEAHQDDDREGPSDGRGRRERPAVEQVHAEEPDVKQGQRGEPQAAQGAQSRQREVV
jgi:hypothetical protein